MDDPEEPGTTVRPTRWAGVPADERARDRRALLIDAAYELFGTEGDAATSVRAVCRATNLNARYFYESFVDLDELLGAVYDRSAGELGELLLAELEQSPEAPVARMRAGIETVLRFITDDPRRARVLFTEGRANTVLAERRRTARRALVDSTAAAGRLELGGAESLTAEVAATMFGGAMEELAEAWIDSRLGTDLGRVIDTAVDLSMSLFDETARRSR